MNIGIRLHDTAGDSLREKLGNAHRQGFSCVHLALAKLIPGFTMAEAPRLLTDELARDVKAALDENDMTCPLLGCYLNLATPDEEELKRTVESYKAHLRFAKLIDAKLVGTETGAPNTAYRTEPACHTEESLQLFIDRLEPVVRYAEEVGQDFGVEAVCRHIMHTVPRTKQVLDAINSPRLQVILDAVNLLDMKNYEERDAIVDAALASYSDRIALLHMKDFQLAPGKADVLSVGCGLGLMDYTALIRFAVAHPDVPMTLEDTKPDNAEGCRLCLEDYAARLA